jgi:hypothetical protein
MELSARAGQRSDIVCDVVKGSGLKVSTTDFATDAAT